MDTNNEDASDAPDQGPGRVLNAQERLQGTNHVDLARKRISIAIPFVSEGVTCGACVHLGKGSYLALTVNDLERHNVKHHPQFTIEYFCIKCGKEYARVHSARCHVAKCKPESQQRSQSTSDLTFKCQECTRSFTSQRGLSTHKRSAHPIVRNAERAAAAVGGSVQIGPRPTRLWSNQETEAMLTWELELLRLGVKKDINLRLAEKLTGKTDKQVKERRALESYKALRETRLSASQADTPTELDLESDASATSSEELPCGPTNGGGLSLLEEEEFGREAESQRLETSSASSVAEVGVASPSRETDNSFVSAEGNMTWASSEAWLEDLLGDDDVFEETSQEEVLGWRESMDQFVDDWRDNIPEKIQGLPVAEALLALTNTCTQVSLDATHKLLVEFFRLDKNSSQQAGDGIKKAGRRRRQKRKQNHATRKMSNYARTQQLFRENPGLLAKHTRMGTDHLAPMGQEVPREELKDLYSELWGQEPERVLFEPGEQEPEVDEMLVLGPVTPSEVIKRLRRIAKNSAPGKDGLKRAQLAGPEKANLLSVYYTVCLRSGLMPTAWKENRTTMIPKEGKDPRKAANHRPITMSSMIARVFWGIIDQRLRAVLKMSPRQKGFVSEIGCFNNVQLFSEVLRHMKATGGGVAVQIDIKKAFDTAPHEAILRALLRKGIPRVLAQYIAQSYEGVCTTINHPDGPIDITLKRGVKQGDPLSPLLFNLLLEPLLDKLEAMVGYKLGDGSVSCLAFADDLVLLANTRGRAQALLNETIRYLGNLGMGIAPDKSYTFEVVKTKDTWFLRDPEIYAGLEKVAYCDPTTELTYLGVRVSPWYGVNVAKVTERFDGTLERLKKLTLKPWQKTELLTKFLMPHYLHQLSIAIPSMEVLKSLDASSRGAIKEMTWLPKTISNGLFYVAKRDGGLGVPRLEQLVGRIALSAGRKYRKSTDPVIMALANHCSTEQRLSNLAKSMKVPWPCTKNDLVRLKLRHREENYKMWSTQTVQGAACSVFKGDSVGNEFLLKPWLLKPTRYMTALQFRTDTTASRASLRRAKIVKPGEDQCRRCGETQETLMHILNVCSHMKQRIIKRHDEIVEILEKESMKKNKSTTAEAMLGITGENLKPDLIVLHQEGVFVVDVAVGYEREGFVEMACRTKAERYATLAQALRKRHNVTHGEVVPIVIGSRGAMPKRTIANLGKIGIKGKGLLRTLSLTALRGSLELYYNFMDR